MNRSLGQLAGEFLGYLQLFAEAPENRRPDLPTLRSHLLSLLDAFPRSPEASACPPEEVEEARFALVAFADETVQRSSWAWAEDWKKDPLQRQLFQTNRAGNEFFDHLNSLRPDQNDAREVYYLCLALGFEGQFAGRESERRALIQQEYERLRVAGHALQAASESHLVPAAYDLAIRLPEQREWGVLPPLLIMGGGAVGVFALLWLLLRWAAVEVPLPPGI